MARKVTAIPISTQKGKRRFHDWEKYLNGDRWELTKGEDFDVSPGGMRVQAFLAAKRRGVKVNTHIDGNKLYVQAKYQRRATDKVNA